MDASIKAAVRNGWELLTLENDRLVLSLTPNRGGDIQSLVDKDRGAELLFQPTWTTPGGPVVPEGADFHEWYLGGWQSLLPNGAGPCVVDGVSHEQHGDIWHQQAQVASGPGDLGLELASSSLPLRVLRKLRLRERTVVVEEEVTNTGDQQVRFMWGHHPTLGGVLIEEGSRVDLAGAQVRSYGPVDTSGRVEPGAIGRWPHIAARKGGDLDLSVLPGPDARSHDVLLLTDLEGGWYAVRNPRRNVGVAVAFPAGIFRWLWMWQPFGGVTTEPLVRGTYALALEPWTSPPGLDKAVASGAALTLGARESVSVQVCMTVFDATERAVSDVTADGDLSFA